MLTQSRSPVVRSGLVERSGRGLWLSCAAAAMALGLVAPRAQAERVDLAVFSNPRDVDTFNLNFSVDVFDTGNDFTFIFKNESLVEASLTDVYFEVGFRRNNLLQINRRQIVQTPGVDFEPPAKPRLPRGKGRINWRGNAFSFGSDRQGGRLNNGVDDPFESLTIRINKGSASVTLDDLLDALDRRGTRVAAMARSINGQRGNNVSLVSRDDDDNGDDNGNGNGPTVGPAPVPTPSAAWSGLALIALLSLRRSRQEQAGQHTPEATDASADG